MSLWSDLTAGIGPGQSYDPTDPAVQEMVRRAAAAAAGNASPLQAGYDPSSLMAQTIANVGQPIPAPTGMPAHEPGVTDPLGNMMDDPVGGRSVSKRLGLDMATNQEEYDRARVQLKAQGLDDMQITSSLGPDPTMMAVALGISGGGLSTRAPKIMTPLPKGLISDVRSDLPAPNIGMGTDTPLFDYSRLTERPDVPQTPLERAPPPAKGIPDWVTSQITDPARIKQYKEVLQAGRDVAGDPNALFWWNTFPLRDRYLGEFGDEAGDATWRSDMNMWSATSPKAAFPQTVRQSSYFNNMLARGDPLPELVRQYQTKNPNAYNLVPTTPAPSPYANFPQHIQNIQNLLQPDRVTLGNNYPLANPKPPSMAQNLVGNWSVPTIDLRDLRAMGMTTKGGKAMEAVDPVSLYGYIESNFHQPLAEQLSKELNQQIAPAQMQSGTWVGAPSYFDRADLSGTSSAIGTLEDSIRRTASSLGLTPEQTLRRGYFRKEFPLLGLGGLGVTGLLGGGVDPDQRSAVVQ